MSDSADPSQAVWKALCELCNALHVRDMHQNGGLKAEAKELRPVWEQFAASLTKAAGIIHSPLPGQGITSIWLRMLTKRAVQVEDSLRLHHGNWDEVVFYGNESLFWLVTEGHEAGRRMASFKRQSDQGLASLLKPKTSALSDLRKLAEEWSMSGSDATTSPPHVDFNRTTIGKLLLDAIDANEISPKWHEDEKFCKDVLFYIDAPSGLIGPHLTVPTGQGLRELVDRFAPAAGDAGESFSETPTRSTVVSNPSKPKSLRERSVVMSSPSGAVQLFGPQFGVLVQDIEQPKLSLPQYDVLMALCEAGERGLKKDDLIERGRHTDAVGILKRLFDKGEPWASVIQLPGVSGQRYRLL